MLDAALRWGYVTRNTAKLADPIGQGRPELKVWNPPQLRIFLEAAKGDRLYPAFLLAASLGLRRGEVVGLAWDHVDLVGGSVTIEQALISVSYDLVMSSPKTSRGRRRLDLSPALVAVLKNHRATQAQERLLLGPSYQECEFGDLVFTKPEGGPLHPQTLSDTLGAT